jgi:hypothetical protein
VRPFADPRAPAPGEIGRARDFAAYERAHGRTVGLWVGPGYPREAVVEAVLSRPPAPDERPLPDDPSCCRPYHDGCDGRLLCHAAPVDAARAILRSGRILSRHRLTGVPLARLAREGGYGDPPDCFDYVCLANGDCVAPDIVAMCRACGRDLSPGEADASLRPGVRFYFDARELFRHPRAAWDLHPVKIRGSLGLAGRLVAAVAPEFAPDGSRVDLDAPPDLERRVALVDNREHSGLASWSTAAFEAALAVAARGSVG